MNQDFPKTILFIGYVWPEAMSTAASQNILSYVHFFAELGASITFVSAAQPTSSSFDFSELDINTVQIELNDSSFDRFVTELKPDLVVFDRFLTEEQYSWRVEQSAPNAIRVLDCEDLHCLRKARQIQYKKQVKEGDNDTFLSQEAPLILWSLDETKREIASIFRCDLSIVLSSSEAKLLTNKFLLPDSHILQIGFLDRKPDIYPNGYEFRKDFVSIGSFKHEPNWNAVLMLKEQIWPDIKCALPKAQCHIYGSYMPKKAKALENKAHGFLMHGFADDQFDVLRKAKLVLAPLNFGAGIKGKLVDAIQTQTPSITTPIGCEGIADKKNWPGIVAKSKKEFVDAAIAIHDDPKKWEHCQSKCASVLSTEFNSGVLKNQLQEKLQYIYQQPTSHRNLNFIGSMLQHHSLKSHQYMSQWIEAKNNH